MSVRHLYLPYCLQRLKDGRYIVLNRYYKPLGMPRGDFMDYEGHATAHAIKGVTAAKAKALSHDADEGVDCIYLYNDGCVPTDSAANWTAYSKRLQLLAALGIKE